MKKVAVVALVLLAGVVLGRLTSPAPPEAFVAPTGRVAPLPQWTDAELDEAIRRARESPPPPR